ncbi:hypothetical protein MMC09_006748 [Bachmanniomyces sp. S44760]|nr:hypothetical protein [Bachmanniomyces sp. S44760]
MDMKDLIDHLSLIAICQGPSDRIVGIGASLGCAVLWSFIELFTTQAFSHMIFIDQAPLQNYTPDGQWGPAQGNYGCHDAASLAWLQATLEIDPDSVYKGMIQSCLGYRSHPQSEDSRSREETAADEEHFLSIAKQGNAVWYGKLMADHTALDWRYSIAHSFGLAMYKSTKVLVVASERSGCFPPAGPLAVVDLVNEMLIAGVEDAEGVTIEWGGHWCYWENPVKFNKLVLEFLNR